MFWFCLPIDVIMASLPLNGYLSFFVEMAFRADEHLTIIVRIT